MKRQGVWKRLRLSSMLVLVLVVGIFQPAQPGRATPELSAPTASVLTPMGPEAQDVQILAQDRSGIELEFVSPAYTLTHEVDDQGLCQRLAIEGYGESGASGAPALPARGVLVGVPPEADLRMIVLDVEQVMLPGKYSLCPVATPISNLFLEEMPEFPGVERVRNSAAYAAPGFVPAATVEILSIGYVRDQRIAELRFAPFQYDAQGGQVRQVQRIRVRLQFEGARYRSEMSNLVKSASEGAFHQEAFEGVLRNVLLNYEAARQWREVRASSPSFAPQPQSVPHPQFRIVTREAGMYQVTYADLLAAAPDWAWDSVDPRTFHVRNQGREVAIRVAGEEDGSWDPGDWLLFYGEQIDSKYTLDNIYWLTWDGFPGMRMPLIEGTPGMGNIPTYFSTTRHLEANTGYQPSMASGNDDRWYWNSLVWPSIKTRDYVTELQNVVAAPISATVRGLLRGYSANPSHRIEVLLNSNSIYSATWASGMEYAFEVNVPAYYLQNGTNTITLRRPEIPAPTADINLINWLQIDYFKAYVAESDQLFFDGDNPGTWKYRIADFSTDVLEVYDITDPLTPGQIHGVQVAFDNASYVLTFEQTIAAEHHYLALSSDRYRAPKRVENDQLSNWRSSDNGADYLIISHRDFITAVQPLAQYYAAAGLRVVTVDVQDLYDEFGMGWADPEAIRDFIAYAYAHWVAPAPAYVLLGGDGHYDFKNNLGRGEVNFIPPYLADVDPWMGETAADNRYVSVSGDDVFPDLYLGRLPVKTAPEATTLVNKILAYAADTSSAVWQERTLFVADNPDSGGNFYAFSDAVANYYVPAPYTSQKIYHGMSPYTSGSATRAAIVNAINTGQLMVNYVGHGSIQFWASEQFMNFAAIGQMTNAAKLPFVTPMTCFEGYYHTPSSATTDYSAIAETIVRKSGGGAIASFSPTGEGLASGHDVMNKALYQAIFFEDVTALGPATTLGKLALAGMGHDYLIETYLLFGDPALRLNVLPADVALSQTATPTTPLYPGDWLTYTLTFTNTGPARANNVVIEDPLPAMLLTPTVTSSGATITPRPDTRFVWDAADLVPGASGRITITVQVPLDYAGTFTHTATIRTTARETATLNNSAPLTTQVIAADVEILKTGPHSALPGQTIEYVLSYGNVGTALAAGVVITDLLHAELLNPVVTSSGPVITPRADQTFVWDVAPLSPGARGCITITAQVNSTFLGGVLSNQSAISTSSPEVRKANNVSAIVATGVLVPDLIVEQAGPAVALPGMDVTYVVTYVNLGNEIASGVVMTDLLPSALQNVTVSSAGAVITLCVGGAYVWNVADLPPATGGRITLTGTIAPEFRGTLVNTATIAAKTPDRDPGDNTAVLSTFVSIADVTIAKTGPTAVLAGERLTYTLAFTNTDNAPATGVVITDTLPPELWEVNVTSSLPGVTARPGTPFVWEVPDLAPGAGGTLTIGGRISPLYRGTLFNQAQIAAASPEATTANNTSARVETFVSRPDVTIAKIGPAQVSPGDVMTYTLVYTNTDNGLATGVVITDVLPAALMTPTVTHVGTEITSRSGSSFVWDVADLAPGAGGVITLTARVRADASADLVNTAWIAAANELNTANNGSAPVVTQLLLPDVLIQKRGPTTAASGDVITYRLIFTNVGTSLATGVVITDVLPASLHGASFIPAGAAVTPRADQTFVWDVADLAPGAGGVLTITATVDAAYTGALTNTASIATSSFESDADHNSDQLVTQITRSYRVYLPLVIRQSP